MTNWSTITDNSFKMFPFPRKKILINSFKCRRRLFNFHMSVLVQAPNNIEPVPYPMVTKINDAIWRQWDTMISFKYVVKVLVHRRTLNLVYGYFCNIKLYQYILKVFHYIANNWFNQYILSRTWPLFNIKMTSYQYNKSPCWDNTP